MKSSASLPKAILYREVLIFAQRLISPRVFPQFFARQKSNPSGCRTMAKPKTYGK
jgi:hypothetical protein